MIAIMAGGRAERMGRGVKLVDMTKGLMVLPDGETLIDRYLKLLKSIGVIESERDVLLCVGYKQELVMDKYPNAKFLTTYDPDAPTDLLPAFLKVIDIFHLEESFVFLMGDSVWSRDALVHFLSCSKSDSIVMYHGETEEYCETYGMAVNGYTGKELIRKANAVESMPVIPAEIKWQLLGVNRIPPRDCRTSCFEQWIDKQGLNGKTRIYRTAPVDDIDWDEDYYRICQELKDGVYDAATGT